MAWEGAGVGVVAAALGNVAVAAGGYEVLVRDAEGFVDKEQDREVA